MSLSSNTLKGLVQYMIDNGVSSNKVFIGSGSFTRPDNATVYTKSDCISNSTFEPIPLDIDLSSYITVGDVVNIKKVRIICSSANVEVLTAYIFPVTFDNTNDNSKLDLPDATIRGNGAEVTCENMFYLNSHVIVEGDCDCIIKTITTHLYVALQVEIGFTPVAEDQFTVVIEGIVKKT